MPGLEQRGVWVGTESFQGWNRGARLGTEVLGLEKRGARVGKERC